MPQIASSLAENPLDLSWCITHRFGIDDAVEAYDTFANRKDGCIKAVFTFE